MISAVTKQYKKDLDGNSVFCSYKMEEDSGKIWTVPLDTANTDYIEIQAWAAIDGNNITDPGA